MKNLKSLDYFNILFLIFMLQTQISFSLIRHKTHLNLNNTKTPFEDSDSTTSITSIKKESKDENENMCKTIQKGTVHKIVSDYKNLAKNNTNKHYFLFFTDRQDNFKEIKNVAKEANLLMPDELEIDFFCGNKTAKTQPTYVTPDSKPDEKFDMSVVYVIENGQVVEKKEMQFFSSEYMDHLLKRFNLHKRVNTNEKDRQSSNSTKKSSTSFLEVDSKVELKSESKLPPAEPVYDLNLAQLKVDSVSSSFLHSPISNSQYFILVEESTNRTMRFIWAMLIVVATSVGCFLLVKSSVDWANSSQTELNKMKMNYMNDVIKEVKTNHTYIPNTEE